MAAVVAHPRWLGMLATTVLIVSATTSLFLSTEVGQQALLDQQVATLESFGQAVSDEQYARLEARLPTMAAVQGASVVVVVPLVLMGLAGILLGVFNGLLGGRATYRQVLTTVAHVGPVSILRSLFVLPLNFARESLSNPANLSVFFPMLDEGSFLAAFLGSIDLFLVWSVLVLAIGLGVLYHRRTGPIAAGFFTVYAIAAAAIAGVKVALGGQ
jgi:hypothetical protein